ncbi:McrC family protein [Candidatus Spongiihabitans sp.]|uniref:McrC family protein n=1 Tax=Candidatus Spongiihabitans sp. TaxID=3101308 RepID=UPI003C6F06A1
MANRSVIFREYDEINETNTNFNSDEIEELKEFALKNTHDKQGNYRPVLELRNGKLKTQNYVGIIQTRKGKVLEILPKVDFGYGSDDDGEKTKKVFEQMLRTWLGVKHAQFNESGIRAMQRFNMLEIFVRLFLENLVRLTKRGLAKHYQLVEENLPCLKGRILFPQHIRANVANRARFYVQYDDFNANRPANRLIHSAIDKLKPMVRQPDNQQLLHQMQIYFSDVPISQNHDDDWRKQKIDRAMQHYQAVMQWVGLFLFGQGLITFSGTHIEHCLLFPMEQIFEDFVADAFRKYQNHFRVQTQKSKKYLATTENRKSVFQMKPDITLKNNQAQFILDTKWKSINKENTDSKHGINQTDMYQLYAYGKKYKCNTVALIYPQTKYFKKQFCYELDDNLRLLCLPFDVTKPKHSVKEIIAQLPC